MATERSPTGRVIEALWQRWARRYAREHGVAKSKREVSANYFDRDPSLLARWTSAAARPGWRFPLARLDELVAVLELSQADVDDLMTARVDELQADEEVMPLLVWLAAYLERTALDNEERQALEAWRAARAKRPLGVFDDGQHGAELLQVFDGLLAMHERRHVEDQDQAQCGAEQAGPGTSQALGERARAAGRKWLLGTGTRRQQTLRSRAETKALLRRLREGRRALP